MPLVRYEVRCEHSLANPELYRTAGQDDSEGLLEGVAMAGLVGIVRQLGDLAEFAAEIFHDLHDDIMTLVSRGRDLKARVARLEVDLPAVEKALLVESSQLKFTCGARSTWRAPLPMNQNLCAQGELPRFVRNFYDDCRGPPRLFLLDKFDEAGRGACVKRYTDPTFFRVSWAASLLSRAEQLRREREAESLKKITAVENAGPKIYTRERLSSALFENLEGFTGDFTPELRSRRVFELPTEGVLTPDSPRSPTRHRVPQVAEGPVLAPLKISAKDIENAKRGRVSIKDDEDEDDDEFFVDALTTMDSDPDSEPGSRTRWEVDNARFGPDAEDSLNHSILKAHVEARRHSPPRQSDEVDDDEDFARRLAVAGFDTVREWENDDQSDIIELASVDDDSLAIVALPLQLSDSKHPSDTLPYTLPDNLSDSEHPSDNLSDSKYPGKLPYTLPDEPPDYLSDTLSDKLSYSTSDKPLSDKLPYTLSDDPPESLPDKPPDTPSVAKLPETFSDKPPDTPSVAKLPETFSDKPPDTPSVAKLPETFSDKVPHKRPDEKRSPNKISDKTPKKAVASKRSDKPSDKTPNKATYQSHESVSLLDSFRPRVKPIVASIEARAQNNNNSKPLDLQVSPVTTPRSRRLWAKDTATVTILQSAELDANGNSNRPSEGNSPEGELELEEGYTSSASSSPKGLPKFCALLSPSESPPRVAEGLMRRPSLFLTNAHFDRKIPRAPPVTPFLADSPSVSRSPSINIKPSPPGNIMLRRPEAPADKRKNAPAPSPRRASDSRVLPLEPSRIQSSSSSLPNPVPRPRTWVDRSDSNVAATLRAIRQAAVVASDDDTGSECRSDC